MDWKSTLKRRGKEAVGKILPMEDIVKPTINWAACAAVMLVVLGAIAFILS